MNPVASLVTALTALTSGISSMPVPVLPPVSVPHESILVQRPASAQRIADRSRIISILQGNNVVAGHPANLAVAPNLTVSGADGCNAFNGVMTVSDQGQIDLPTVTLTKQACPTTVDREFWQVLRSPVVLFVDPDNHIYLTNGVDTLPLVKG